MQRFLDCLLPIFAGIIGGGFLGWLIATVFGPAGSQSDGTGIGALVGLPVGIALGLYFTRKR